MFHPISFPIESIEVPIAWYPLKGIMDSELFQVDQGVYADFFEFVS